MVEPGRKVPIRKTEKQTEEPTDPRTVLNTTLD